MPGTLDQITGQMRRPLSREWNAISNTSMITIGGSVLPTQRVKILKFLLSVDTAVIVSVRSNPGNDMHKFDMVQNGQVNLMGDYRNPVFTTNLGESFTVQASGNNTGSLYVEFVLED